MPNGMRPRAPGPLQIGPYAEKAPPGAVSWQGDPNAPIHTPGGLQVTQVIAPPERRAPLPPIAVPVTPAPPEGTPPPAGTVVLPEPKPPESALPPVPTPTPAPGPAGRTLPTDVIGLLQAILRELWATAQAGRTYSLTTLVQAGVEPTHVLFDPPLFAINITCDGGGTIEYRLPDSGSSNWIALRPNETITYSSTRATWKSIGFRVPGANATVRVVGQL